MAKICHMTSAHAPEDDRIFHKECVSLAKAGHQVYLVEQGDSYEKSGVHLVGIGSPSEGRLRRMLYDTRRVYEKALALDADIYHLHDPELLPFGLKLKKRGKKVIFDSHECYREQIRCKQYLPRWLAAFIAACYGIFERYTLRRLDAVIFPCTMNGRNPFEGYCKRTPIISNAAILSEFFDQYDPNGPKLADSVCYVGGLTEERGITNNMLAAKKAGAVLLLAGEFSPEDYQEKLSAMEAFSCVDYRGKLDRKAVAQLLSESRIGICTLLDRGQYFKIDTFGIKVFEYMSMGLPVILSRSPYNQKMVERFRFGICVDPENVDEIAAAIRRLLDNPKEARRMGENGRRAIQEEFNWGVEEKKLLALYEDILQE